MFYIYPILSVYSSYKDSKTGFVDLFDLTLLLPTFTLYSLSIPVFHPSLFKKKYFTDKMKSLLQLIR